MGTQVEVYMIILSCLWSLVEAHDLGLRFSLTAFIAFQELIDKFLIRLIIAFGPNLEELGSSKIITQPKHLMWDECVSVLVLEHNILYIICLSFIRLQNDETIKSAIDDYMAYSYLAAA
ncbi:hypothetical protein ACJX0J_014775 [Zea mays]